MIYSRLLNIEEELCKSIQNTINILKRDMELMRRVQINFSISLYK